MSKIENMVNIVTRLAGRSTLQFKKFSPEILMGVGIIGVVGTVVLASRATLKLESIVDKTKNDLDTRRELYESNDGPTSQSYRDLAYSKAVAKVYIKTGIELGKIYGPSLALGAVSITCLIGSHGIMKERNAALTVAYVAVERAYNAYRARVVEEHGEEKDLDYHLGRRDEVVTTKDEVTGKKVKVVNKIIDPNTHSAYARFFDDSCVSWQRNAEYNLMFLQCQQSYMNDMLHARGHVFLNEVYDRLGIPRTSAGAVVGWVMTQNGDNFIDFGLFDKNNMRAREFVNGYEHSILLDFNVNEGTIYNKI